MPSFAFGIIFISEVLLFLWIAMREEEWQHYFLFMVLLMNIILFEGRSYLGKEIPKNEYFYLYFK